MLSPEDAAMWQAAEDGVVDTLEARTLFMSSVAAHDHAMVELKRSEAALWAALSRADRARWHAERAGKLLTDAIRLMELRGPA